ncbi:MAG: glycoside hydrolase family 127 protein, partial [bacterium]|nr:glycoside hydrolase family 127 protein [Candidatus Colisoma equi]
MRRFLIPVAAVILWCGQSVGAPCGRLKKFAPGCVTVGGEIGHRMELTIDKMLHHTDIENTFAKHFRVRKEKPDEPWGFAGYGMFLDALVKATANGIGGEEAKQVKTRLLEGLAAAQTPDGRITMYLNKAGFWDNHEGAYMIQALCLDHRVFGCRRSLETAVRLADSLIRDKACVTLGSETAFILLAQETGDAKYVQWLETTGIIRKSIDEYDRHLHVNGIQHVYTWLARSLGQMQYADFMNLKGADRESLGAGAFAAFRRLRGPELSITGSCSGVVQWGELWDSTQAGLGKWGETCATAYLMRLAAKMPEWDPKTHYGDVFERALYNAFFSSQSGDGLKYRYFTPFEEKAEWFDRDTYCCPNNFKREMFEIPEAVFYRTDDGLVVNLYTPAALKTADVSAAMETAY